jgi:hypothetical protein
MCWRMSQQGLHLLSPRGFRLNRQHQSLFLQLLLQDLLH